MSAALTPDGSEDKAWVVISTSLRQAELRRFCHDLERLFRINPYLEFKLWRVQTPGHIHTEFHNLSNLQDYALDLEVVAESEDVFLVRYAQGIKALTRFEIQAQSAGATLTITDDYSHLPQDERVRRAHEVDRSLPAWGQALFEYLRRQRRYGWIAPWRWYMRKVWVPMKPSARRIVWMLYLITAVELAAVLLIALIWWLEHRV
jgi:hypothetical protein